MCSFQSKFSLLRWLILIFTGLVSSVLALPDLLQIDASIDNGRLSIRDWQQGTIRLRYNCSSTTANAAGAKITMTLPKELEAVSLTGSIHTTSTNYDTALRQATFTFVNPLPAGSSGDVFVKVRFLKSTPENTLARVKALFAASNSLSKSSQEVQIVGINAPTGQTYTFVKGMKITKTVGSGKLDANDGYSLWSIKHGNTGATGQNISNYTIEDTFPAGLSLDSLRSDRFPGTSNSVTVHYKTNLNSTYRQWGVGPLYKTGDGEKWFYPESLGLSSGEYVTALKWSYGTLNGGGLFHPDALSKVLRFYTRVVNPSQPAFAEGKTITNCATVTGTNETSQNSCASQTMSAPAPNFGFWHYISNPGSSPYMAGSKIRYTIAFGINAASSTAVTNPSLGVLLPAELSYSGNPIVNGEAFTDAGSPAPKFFQTPNWKGTGRTLVRWSWSPSTGNALTIPYQRNSRYMYVNFDATISSSTTDGAYRSTAYGNWTPNGKGGNWFEQDVEDWDSNNNTTEKRARHDMNVNVKGLAPRFDFGHRIHNNSSPYEMNEQISYTAYIQNKADSSAPLIDPVIALLLPKEFEYVGNAVLSGNGYTLIGKTPVFQKVDNFEGTGQTLVRWVWSAATANSASIPATGSSNTLNVTFDARIKQWTPNGHYLTKAFGNWNPGGKGFHSFQNDTTDFDGNGNTTELRAFSEGWTHVLTAGGSAGFNSEMLVKGELDSAWTAFPAQGLTIPGGKADYKLTLSNPSGVVMRNLVLIDILPFVGDTGVIDLSPRGSQWSPYLAAPVTAAGATVSYSLSGKPCRDELTPGIPVGCDPPNWSVVPPADITKVKSIKIDFGTKLINPGDKLVIQWPMRAPLNAPMAGEVAFNSFGYTAVRNDDGSSLLASEPIKTGISIKPPDPPFYGDFVWNDTNRNGIQDNGEVGVNGIRVELYRDNGDKVNDPAGDTLVGFTTTAYDGYKDGAYLFANMGAGDYYALVIPPADWGISPKDQGADHADSDGEAIIFKGGRAALMPITTLTSLEDDRTWDQGLFDRSGEPSVWAAVPMADGRSVLGGRFQTSHGLARKNIVVVNKDGTVDKSFNPGTGFDGVVRSLALLGNGKILAGGNFTTYAGNSAYGIALINPDGTFSGALPAPDVNAVRWVGTSPEGLYVAGSFNHIAGVPCRCFARIKMDGTLDTAFNTTNGANGDVNSGAVQPDGKIIIAGNFTSYNGVARNRLARINKDGTLDTTFDPAGGAGGEVFSVKLLEDGRIIVSGSFTNFASNPCNGTTRLLPTGALDTGLSPSALKIDSIQTTN